MKKWQILFLVSLFLFCLSACSGTGDTVVNESTSSTIQPASLPSHTIEPTLTFTPAPTFTPSATPVVVLDPEPVAVKFEAADGVELEGMYYPAAENPAPLIILVHWARGDMSEWEQISLWLQDRGQLIRNPDYNTAWKSADWFPLDTVESPLGVFVFTLRECRGGCKAYLPEKWLLDIQAAMVHAAQLQGVNKEMILTAGASIGADGALFGCAWINQTEHGSCLGSFSLSPASLLTIAYEELSSQLINGEPSLPVYCLFGLRDDASVETCSGIPGLVNADYGYIENHGFELIQPGQDPDPLILLNEFITLSLSGAGE